MKNNPIQFEDLVSYCKSIALNEALNPTEESVYRGLCRQYSVSFHVPLPQVYLLDPEHVISEVYAFQLSEIDVEEKVEHILEEIYTLEDPDYSKDKENELKEFIHEAELQEEERLKKKQPLHKAIKKSQLESKLPEPEKPTRGGVNFANLGDSEG